MEDVTQEGISTQIAALYARVSTGNQEKQETIQSQVAEDKARIVNDGRMLGENLSFCDDGWPGDVLARPALDQLRDAVRNKLFQVLYVYDLGRLSRDFPMQLMLKQEIENAGIKIISLHDINNVSAESKFAQNVMGLFHDYERIKIAERFRRGKLYKVKNGILFGWNAPYGYQYIKGDKKTIPGSFTIIEDEAKIVKMLFDWLVNEQMTIRQIISRLYNEKIQPKKSKRGYWSTSTLSRLFRDETYIGSTYYNKKIAIEPTHPLKKGGYKKIKKSSRKIRPKSEWLSITVPSIIDTEMFSKAQQQLKTNSQFCMRNRVHEYLLSTLVSCTCGNTRAGEGVRGHLYYRCTDRVNRFPLPKECHAMGVNATILDNKVWRELYELITNPALIEKQHERFKTRTTSASTKPGYVDPSKLKKDLDEQKELENRFVKAFGAKVISLEQLQTQLTEIKLKKSQIMGKLAASRNDSSQQPNTIVLPDLRQFCDKMKTEIDNLNFKERQFIVRQLVDTVTTDGVTATVEGSVPLFISKENTQNYYEQRSINRYCRIAKRRKINSF